MHDLELTTKSGETKIVDACFVKVDINGEAHSVSHLVDMTDQKTAEAQLREDHAKLQVANEKLQVVGSLTRHDVKNKHSVINGNIYLIKKKLGDNPSLVKYLDNIEAAVKAAERIFQFSALYEKIGVEQPSSIDVAESFNQAIELHSEKASITTVNKCRGLRVIADSMLGQLFYNLIDNSLKHGKKVTKIKLTFEKNDDGIHLFYEDNGIGVPKENKEKIFTEGFTTGGSGLGLKLVRKMVEAYGWTIKENGAPGKGARFDITIAPNSKIGSEVTQEGRKNTKGRKQS